MLFVSITVLLALLIDRLFGEAPRFHPLVGFGNLAYKIEAKLNASNAGKMHGVFAWILVVIPISIASGYIEFLVSDDLIAHVMVSSFVLYSCIGWQSLKQHITPITEALTAQDLPAARKALALIVSRDTQNLDETDIATAATESTLENGADAIFSAIFWFIIGGIPGVVLYRLSNTLDAMWGYKNSRFLHFGWCAAKIDDLLNYIPARLTAYSYALMGHTTLSLQALRLLRGNWKSPNAGPVMAAGAGAINVQLGGSAQYHGELQERPRLGLRSSPKAKAQSLGKALSLVNRSLVLWCTVILIIESSLLYLSLTI